MASGAARSCYEDFLSGVLAWTPRKLPSPHATALVPRRVNFVPPSEAPTPPERDELYDADMDDLDEQYVAARKSCNYYGPRRGGPAGTSGPVDAGTKTDKDSSVMNKMITARTQTATTTTSSAPSNSARSPCSSMNDSTSSAAAAQEATTTPNTRTTRKRGREINVQQPPETGASLRSRRRNGYESSGMVISGSSDDGEFDSDSSSDVSECSSEALDGNEQDFEEENRANVVPAGTNTSLKRPHLDAEESAAAASTREDDAAGIRSVLSCPSCFALLAENAEPDAQGWWRYPPPSDRSRNHPMPRVEVLVAEHGMKMNRLNHLMSSATTPSEEHISKTTTGTTSSSSAIPPPLDAKEVVCACVECGTPVGYAVTKVRSVNLTQATYRFVCVLVDSSWGEDLDEN
ncbi:unnamed protein product [Amoebophrya sp. A120]|nr:unnamed protein product [Amoebophrya sp. A120]|eukprot:GSA120T00010992001.1